MSPAKRLLPPFLEGKVDRPTYERWLKRKAAAHAKRDQKRFEHWKSGSDYRNEIHEAVLRSNGRDAYTGEELDWSLISKYDNEESKIGRHKYKSGFALLPTVDHIESDNRVPEFCICGWRTNDAKHDLSLAYFLALCEKVLRHHGYSVAKDS
jgi:hypothetical protein